MRGIIFIKRSEAITILYRKSCTLPNPAKVHQIVTPRDLRANYVMTDDDIVELEVRDGSETVRVVDPEDVYAMHKCLGDGIYTPWLNVSQPNLIGKQVSILESDWGWTHPMPNWTLGKNKDHIEDWAYKLMLKRIAKSDDVAIQNRVEEILWNEKLTKDMIREFFL